MRYTRKQVEAVFETFVKLAGKTGFDTETWFLKPGQGSEPAWEHYCHKYPNGEITTRYLTTEFSSFLGSTAREAYDTLAARIDTLRAIRGLRTPDDF